jgi:hypothetical protein
MVCPLGEAAMRRECFADGRPHKNRSVILSVPEATPREAWPLVLIGENVFPGLARPAQQSSHYGP